MQLDRTEISIYARSTLELLDLSLLVLRRHFRRIALTSCMFGLPLLVLDVWLVAWMLSEDTQLLYDQVEDQLYALRWRHALHLIVLFATQFPLISLPTTIFLGACTFYEPLSLRALWQRLLPIAARSVIILGVLRLGLLPTLGELVVERGVVFDGAAELWLVLGVGLLAMIIRSVRPFAPEIIGLERCPLRRTDANQVSYWQRAGSLHRRLLSENFSRFVGSASFSILLVLSLLSAQLFVCGIITGRWQWNSYMDHLGLPLALWVVGLLMAVFRFLAYIDTRIRQEGWEIELRIRAEAERLQVPRVSSGGAIRAPEEAIS